MRIFVSRIQSGPIVDVDADGNVRPARGARLSDRVLAGAVIAAVIAGALGVAMLALWLALSLIPIALGAALVAWIIWKFRTWRRGGGGPVGPFGGDALRR